MRDGTTCHYSPCAGAVDVIVELAFGTLLLCEAHWSDARPELEECATFQSARRAVPAVLAG